MGTESHTPVEGPNLPPCTGRPLDERRYRSPAIPAINCGKGGFGTFNGWDSNLQVLSPPNRVRAVNLRKPTSGNELVAFHLQTGRFVHFFRIVNQRTRSSPAPTANLIRLLQLVSAAIAHAHPQGVKSERNSPFRNNVPRNGATSRPWKGF